MKICPIFVPPNDPDGENGLYAVRYDKAELDTLKVSINERYAGHELARLLYQWTDARYLKYFYDSNQAYWKDPYWAGLNQQQFALDITESVPVILDDLKAKCGSHTLASLFAPLHKTSCKDEYVLELKSKYRHIAGKRAIRLYAVKVDGFGYVITGGALKITPAMSDHPLTKLELKKLAFVKAYFENL